MSIFKNKKNITKDISKRSLAIETELKKAEPKSEIKSYRASTVLIIKPLVTEKTRNLAIKNNKYIFIVKKESNKKEVKKAIENLYKVEVMDVNIINVKSKPKRLGRNMGKSKQFKKAIITVRKGQTIDVIPT